MRSRFSLWLVFGWKSKCEGSEKGVHTIQLIRSLERVCVRENAHKKHFMKMYFIFTKCTSFILPPPSFSPCWIYCMHLEQQSIYMTANILTLKINNLDTSWLNLGLGQMCFANVGKQQIKTHTYAYAHSQTNIHLKMLVHQWHFYSPHHISISLF